MAEYTWESPKRLKQCLDHAQGIEFNFNYSSANSHSPNILNLHILRATHINLHLFAMLGQEKMATLHCGCDQVGTLKLLTDENGFSIKRIQYDSFGNIISETEPEFRLPIGFAGGLQDYDTGLVILGHRTYDPVLGRFLSKDPLGDTGGEGDLYDYCIDDPVNMVDPDGLKSKLAMLLAGAGVLLKKYTKRLGLDMFFPDDISRYQDLDGIQKHIAEIKDEIAAIEREQARRDQFTRKNIDLQLDDSKDKLKELETMQQLRDAMQVLRELELLMHQMRDSVNKRIK